MVDLRIVGVDDEGNPPRLSLCDESGHEFSLPIDEALRTALSTHHQSSSPSAQRAASPLSPRDIQARLRAGGTIDEVIAASGLSRDHVIRYAGPVADERAFYAARARESVVARTGSTMPSRSALLDTPATLEEVAAVRLRTAGVLANTVTWDAWRREDGRWAVACDFSVDSSTGRAGEIGAQPPAEWVFDPAARSLTPVNEWAESLMSLPTADETPRRSGRRLTAVEEPFNVDEHSTPTATVGTTGGPQVPRVPATPANGAAGEDLLDILRARRGQRLGADESGDDKLATLLTRDERGTSATTPGVTSSRRPVATPHPVGDNDADDDEQDTARLPRMHRSRTAATPTESPAAQDHPASGTDAWGFSYADSGEDESEPAPTGESATDQATDQEQADPKPKRKSASRRPAMPRWDDILFGQRSD